MNFEFLIKHTKSMKVLIIVLLVILLLLILPLKFKIHFFYNIYANSGFVLASLFCFKLLFYKMKVEGLNIVLKNQNGTKTSKIDMKTQNIDFINAFQLQVLKRLFLNNVTLFSAFGSKEDAFTTAMVGGGISMLFSNLKIFILSKKSEANCYYKSMPCYNLDRFNVMIKSEFFITLFDVILSLLIAQIKVIKKRRMKNGQQLSSH